MSRRLAPRDAKGMTERPGSSLSAVATQAAQKAYAPYSKFRVGAAVRVGTAVFTGCNVENASYGLCICAERVAIFQAVSAGAKIIDALAVSCIDAETGAIDALMPCGACRQVMAEFGKNSMSIEVVGAGVFRLEDLLPHPFRLPQHSES